MLARDSRRGRDSAFTLVEGLAAIALLVLLAGLGYGAVSAASGSVRRSLAETYEAANLLETEERLRREVGSIELPFWAPDSAMKVESDSAELSYYRGKAESALRLAFDGSHLVLASPGGRHRLGPFEAAAFSLLLGEEKEPRGLRVSLKLGGREVPVDAVFGATPLRHGLSQ